MDLPEGLEIRPSPIHGLGVFATRNFPDKYCFGIYTGQEMSWKEFIEKYGRDYHYCYRMLRTHKIIVAKEQRNFITFVNSGPPNTILKNKKLYSCREIKEGEELLLNYGRIGRGHYKL